MSNIAQVDPKNDEVVLCVRYTTVLSWLLPLLLLLTGLALCYGSYLAILREHYWRAFVMALGSVITNVYGIEELLTKYILFYRYRIDKVWHFIGKRTIPYSKAKLAVNPPLMREWPGWGDAAKSFRVMETDTKGRALLMQIPIGYCYLCVSSDARKNVEIVTSYLVGIEDSTKLYEESRTFVQSSLPRRMTCQDR